MAGILVLYYNGDDSESVPTKIETTFKPAA